MKGFKKLALVTAVAALPMSGFAMEALDDATLSGVTGQDGIVVTLNVPTLNMDVIVHDNDGFAGHATAGGIFIDNMSLATGAGGIVATIDAGDDGTNTPILNVAVSIPTSLTINTGNLYVGTSNGIATGGITNQSGIIMDSMAITLGATNLNIQLGNEDQLVGGIAGTQMIALDTTMTGGLSISNMALRDANSSGAIGAASVTVTNAGDANLDVVAGVNVTAAGLVVTIDTLGTGGMTVKMIDQYLGASTNIVGDVEITGLNLANTSITVAGKP